MRRTLLAVAIVGVMAGCATPTTGPLVIDRGPAPTMEQAQEAVLRYLERALKDPDSIKQFRLVSEPRPISWFNGLLRGGGHSDGWLICFEYNAKNSFGGYVGLQTDGIVLRVSNGTAVMFENVNWVMADARC